MASVTDLMAAGMPAAQANMLGSSVLTGLTATGTVQADALPLAASLCVFSTVGSGAGAILPTATASSPYWVSNDGANALLVYPAVGEQINSIAVNGAFSVTNGKTARFGGAAGRWIALLSA